MLVRDRVVPVQVRVRFAGGISRPVGMLVVLVMGVNVVVDEFFVRVKMDVARANEHGDTGNHQDEPRDSKRRNQFVQERNGDDRTDEGGGREVR